MADRDPRQASCPAAPRLARRPRRRVL